MHRGDKRKIVSVVGGIIGPPLIALSFVYPKLGIVLFCGFVWVALGFLISCLIWFCPAWYD